MTANAMESERIETRAVTFAEAYYESIGWAVKNVSRVRGNHAGYDLFLEKDGEKLMVEVKGCSRLFQIPDLYGSEIDAATQMLIADELCVVYFQFIAHGNSPILPALHQKHLSQSLQSHCEYAAVFSALERKITSKTLHQRARDVESQAAGFRIPLKGAKERLWIRDSWAIVLKTNDH